MKHTPLKAKGRRGLENDKIRAHVWPKVLRRAYGVGGAVYCEGCKARGGVEWAHLFGRPGSGFCLGPIANSAELTAALCRECHNGVDRNTDPMLAHELRWKAMARLVATLTGATRLPVLDGAPYEGIRVVIAEAEKQGWRFDEERYELVRA